MRCRRLSVVGRSLPVVGGSKACVPAVSAVIAGVGSVPGREVTVGAGNKTSNGGSVQVRVVLTCDPIPPRSLDVALQATRVPPAR
ncbi:MAG: hypothetical protein JO079_12410 [Frankiaceae bacterium]|nr:hypothetical protein [Frankiaceae bacterium]MBV9368889.1 hypothetical protein [Frankiales bacterium]